MCSPVHLCVGAVCRNVETRGQPYVSFLRIPSILAFEAGSPTSLELINWSRLASQQAPWIQLLLSAPAFPVVGL